MLKKIFGLLILLIAFLSPVILEGGITVNGELTHEKTAEPGTVYTGVIVFENDGDQIEEVKIIQTDYLFYCDGSNRFGDPGSVPRSNAAWIEYSPKRVILPPHEETVVNYTVRIPQGDTLSGTYWSLIIVEPIPRTSPESSRKEPTVGLTTVLRYAIQMVTHVGNDASKELKFLGAKLYKDENRTLQIDIENTGERLLRPSVWVELFDENGVSHGKFEGKQRRIFPTTSIRQKIDVSSVEEGTYKALVVADCGDEDIFGIQYTIKIEK
jgi:hypothetical protein